MFIRAAIVAVSIACVLMPAAPAPAPAERRVWESANRRGSVTVNSGRDVVTVCDFQADDTYVEAEYATSFLAIHKVADSNGALAGCAVDRVILGRVDVFKLCYGKRHVWRQCDQSIWLKHRK
ncbi:hypothetical protein [Spongiactinospora sp. 9N601]|uniref:hypothetical protein n=1 Tax=Spongiactinospora sp. 9N601 TaxID=3375149 RepID=UPI003798EB7A